MVPGSRDFILGLYPLLSMSFNSSEPQFFHLQNGYTKLMYSKSLAQDLAWINEAQRVTPVTRGRGLGWEFDYPKPSS